MTDVRPSGPDREADDPGQTLGPGSDEPSRVPLDMYRLLVASVRDYAIFILDRNGHVLSWNPGAARLKGYAADEIVGKHLSVFYPREAIEAGHPAYELAVAEARGRYEEEGWRLRKGEARFWARVTITAVRDDNGLLVGFGKVTRDLTDQKEGNEALRQSEERFKLLVQSVQDYGIFMLDPGGHVVSWNLGAERIKGYEASEILGRHFSTFYPQEDVERDKPGMELKVAEAVGRFEDEGWRLTRDGSRFWANVVITALRDDSGALVGYAKVTRDLTARRAAEVKAMEDTREFARLDAANRAKTELLALLSHELRTPLNAIAGYVDLLIHGIFGDMTKPQLACIERIRASEQHLVALVDDLLDLGKIEAGRLTYRIAPIAVGDVVSNVATIVGPLALAHAISIDWQPTDPTAIADADPARVEQIVVNLVTNAVKYTESGGHVVVRHFVRDDRVVIEVSDNGRGIPPELQEAIFEPFTQLGQPFMQGHPGTGLGLAISRDHARAMHGDLTVRSSEEGSTFTLELPRPD
jgi:hypothetical protein